MSLSDNLKLVMESKGLSASRLEKISKVPASRISDIVNNKTLNPQMKTINKLAKALDVDASELIANGGHKNVALSITGENHHIDVHHCAEPAAEYSPAIGMIAKVTKEWPDKKINKLLKVALEMDEDSGG